MSGKLMVEQLYLKGLNLIHDHKLYPQLKDHLM